MLLLIYINEGDVIMGLFKKKHTVKVWVTQQGDAKFDIDFSNKDAGKQLTRLILAMLAWSIKENKITVDDMLEVLREPLKDMVGEANE